MAAVKIPFNQSQFINTNLAVNGTDNSQKNDVNPTSATGFYLTRTALNATTGQSENDTFLLIN